LRPACPDERVWPADIRICRKKGSAAPAVQVAAGIERRLHGREWVMEQQRKAAEEAAAWEEAIMEAAE
jgi:hypothetical protein